MKMLAFTAGVSVGAIATVGAIVGASLIGINKITKGAVGETLRDACADLRDAMLDKEKND
jgi:hypothetical protein